MGKRLVWLVLGLFAIAGCEDLESFRGFGLENRRNHSLDVTVRAFEGDCVGPGQDLAEREAYGVPVSRRLLPGDLVSLVSLRRLTWGTHDPQFGVCGAVWIELPGLYEGVLAWDSAPLWNASEADPFPHSVLVEGTRDEVALTLPEDMRELPPPE